MDKQLKANKTLETTTVKVVYTAVNKSVDNFTACGKFLIDPQPEAFIWLEMAGFPEFSTDLATG